MGESLNDPIHERREDSCCQLNDEMLAEAIDYQPAQLVGFAEDYPHGVMLRLPLQDPSKLDGSIDAPCNPIAIDPLIGIPCVHPYADAAMRIIKPSPDPFSVTLNQIHLFPQLAFAGGLDDRRREYPWVPSQMGSAFVGLQKDLAQCLA